MAKKLICFPFVNGNLQEYSFNNLTDSERERVYNGEEVVKEFVYDKNKKEIWKPNEEVELTLHYQDYGRGRSAVTFYWVDDDGHEYPMFIKDVDELLRQDMGTSSVHAIFTYVKRGANYGIKFLRRAENNEQFMTKMHCDICGEDEVMTNFEYIKSMTAEQFFDFVYDLELYKCNGCPVKSKCGGYDSCTEAFIEWLNTEHT
jgi:hypothetical protein